MHPEKGLTRQPRAVFLEVVVAAIDARACATARHNARFALSSATPCYNTTMTDQPDKPTPPPSPACRRKDW
jgi:hypothetical protein